MAADEAIVKHGDCQSAPPASGQETGQMMPLEWYLVLELAGAQFEGSRVSRFGLDEAERGRVMSGDAVADLSHFGLIAVEGPDARKFLSSLFTGDVRQISPTQGQFTSWCDGKGRILTTFWLFMRGETFYLLLPQELVPTTRARLRQYLLRTRASITDASGSLVRLGLSGPRLAARLEAILGAQAPMAQGETHTAGGCTLIAIGATPQPRWLAVGPVGKMNKLWENLHPKTMAVDAGAWSLLDILAGIPMVTLATSAEFIPQMLNLEALGGLSFTKGCYPGQEVVARLQYRGQLKRRLYLAYVDSDRVPPPGAKLYGPGVAESVGMVLSAACAGAGKVALLAVVVIERKDSGDIHLEGLQGPRLDFREPAAGATASA